MNSGDTPLNSTALLIEKQKNAQSPYVILSGGGQTFSTGWVTIFFFATLFLFFVPYSCSHYHVSLNGSSVRHFFILLVYTTFRTTISKRKWLSELEASVQQFLLLMPSFTIVTVSSWPFLAKGDSKRASNELRDDMHVILRNYLSFNASVGREQPSQYFLNTFQNWNKIVIFVLSWDWLNKQNDEDAGVIFSPILHWR